MSLFGRFYRVMTFGQSHSTHVGCVIQGFPSNFKVNLEQIQKELSRRRAGQSILTTPRDEKDIVQCISGMERNITLGSPLSFIVKNQNILKKDYSSIKNIPRPGHADYTYLKKYGVKAESGGGRSSARETIGRVIAGALAKQYLSKKGILFSSWVKKIYNLAIPETINRDLISSKISNRDVQLLGEVHQLKNQELWTPVKASQKVLFARFKWSAALNGFQQIGIEEQYNENQIISVSNTRCPYQEASVHMYRKIKEAKQQQNSLGGIVQGCIYGLPVGLGEPIFDKFPALIAHAMLSIPATKGIQFGSGFRCAEMYGSQHNDKFDKQLHLATNNSGGTLGGITSGSVFQFNVAFKPVSSIAQPQQTHDFDGKPVTLISKGRHDPCVLPRAPPIVDNMAAIVVMDLLMAHRMPQQTSQSQ